MRKLLLSQAMFDFKIFFCLLVGSLEASLIGNPADPSILDEGFWISDCNWSSARMGISGDFLLQKRMRPCKSSRGEGIFESEMNWKMAVWDVGWNIRERFDLHLLAGPVASVDVQWLQNNTLYEAAGDQGVFWGASSKFILLEMEDTALGVDFHGGGVQWIEGPLTVNGTPEEDSFSSRLYFWQIAGGFSQNLGVLRPYIGAVTSHLVYILSPSESKSIRFHDLLAAGLYEGCTLSFGSRVFLNLEARQFFESGISISGEFRF